MARSRTRGAGRASRASRAERMIFGVPERFMRPRLVLLAAVVVLLGFGLLMVYSASSVTALSATGDAAYYLKRQALFACAGAAIAVGLALVDYHVWVRLIVPVWAVTVLLLLIVIVAGTDNEQGANRWIDLGFFDLQPSEFAKISIVFTAAAIAERYYEEGSIDGRTFLILLGLGVDAEVGVKRVLVAHGHARGGGGRFRQRPVDARTVMQMRMEDQNQSVHSYLLIIVDAWPAQR